jgi:hypothetical protein
MVDDGRWTMVAGRWSVGIDCATWNFASLNMLNDVVQCNPCHHPTLYPLTPLTLTLPSITMSVPTSSYSLSHAVSTFNPAYRLDRTSTSSSSDKPPTYDILIYGATSFTGKLVIHYLLQHPQASKFTFALAGRTLHKLEALADKVESDGHPKPDIVCFSLEEGGRQGEQEEGAERAVAGCRVVVNLAGPFSTQNAEMLIRSVCVVGRPDLVATTISKADSFSFLLLLLLLLLLTRSSSDAILPLRPYPSLHTPPNGSRSSLNHQTMRKTRQTLCRSHRESHHAYVLALFAFPVPSCLLELTWTRLTRIWTMIWVRIRIRTR